MKKKVSFKRMFLLLLISSIIAGSLIVGTIFLYENHVIDSLCKTLTKSTIIHKIPSTDLEWVNELDKMNIDLSFLEVDFKKLTSMNKDTALWMQIGGTKIYYPVVQTIDNEFYYQHTFDKSKNPFGWIFGDYRNNFLDLNEQNVIYFPTRLKKTGMDYLDTLLTDTWYNNKENHFIYLSTPNDDFIYQIFSIYQQEITASWRFHYQKDDSTYLTYLTRCKNQSQYSFDITLSAEDKILTLTSFHHKNHKNIVVHAKLIKRRTRN